MKWNSRLITIFLVSFIWFQLTFLYNTVSGRSKVLVLFGRQKLCGQRNLLAHRCHSISGSSNQLNRKWIVESYDSFFHMSKCSHTFPPWLNAYPLPLISWPFMAVTPPVMAFTAWNNVFRIDFFNSHASKCSFSWNFTNKIWFNLQ